MIETHEIEEAFRKLISEKLGIKFFQRRSPHNSVFLINIEAFPKNIVTDNEILPCLQDCFNAMGFELNLLNLNLMSMRPDDAFTWIEVKKGEEKFSVGVTNATTFPLYIIITFTKL